MAGAHAPIGNVLITGAARRIGAAIARALAANGYAVASHYRHSLNEAEALRDEIVMAGGKAVLRAADLENPAEAETLMDRASDALGEPFHALVNNASVFAFERASDANMPGLEAHFRAHVFAPILIATCLVQQISTAVRGVFVHLFT